MISERYINKDKRDDLSGIIITRIYTRRVTRKHQLCIFMKHDKFEDSDFNCVKWWVKVETKVSEAHAFEDIEDKEDETEVTVE